MLAGRVVCRFTDMYRLFHSITSAQHMNTAESYPKSRRMVVYKSCFTFISGFMISIKHFFFFLEFLLLFFFIFSSHLVYPFYTQINLKTHFTHCSFPILFVWLFFVIISWWRAETKNDAFCLKSKFLWLLFKLQPAAGNEHHRFTVKRPSLECFLSFIKHKSALRV